MPRERVPLLLALLLAAHLPAVEPAAEPSPAAASAVPVVAVRVQDLSLAMRARWQGEAWQLEREDLSIALELTATAARPVLRLEILRIDRAVDGTGRSLMTQDTNRFMGTAGQWWNPPDCRSRHCASMAIRSWR